MLKNCLLICSVLSVASALTCYNTRTPSLNDLFGAIGAGNPSSPSFIRAPRGANVSSGCYACVYAIVNDNPLFNGTSRRLYLSGVMMSCAVAGNYSSETNEDGIIGDLLLHNREYKDSNPQRPSGPLPISLADRNVVGPLRSLATMMQGDCATVSLKFQLPSGFASVCYCCSDYCNAGPECSGSSMAHYGPGRGHHSWYWG